jgi:hypothetical protein
MERAIQFPAKALSRDAPSEHELGLFSTASVLNLQKLIFAGSHGFAPTTTYELVWDQRCYPPKAVLAAAYEFAIGNSLDPVISKAGRPAP